MAEIRKIAFKGTCFLLLLLGLNFLYRHIQYRDEVLREFPEYTQIEAAAEGQILYLGESSDLTYSDYDESKAPIHDFLQAHFPGIPLRAITKEASHAGHYLRFLQNIPSNSAVKAVVVTMNLRAFNAQWVHSKLESALSKSTVLIGPGPALWRRFLLSFRQYDRRTEAEQAALFKQRWREDRLHFPYPFPHDNVQEWDSALSRAANRDPARAWLIRLATHYVKAYAFEIDTLSHPRIADFDAIADLARARGWKLVYNLLPENMEMADSLLGDTLTHFMRDNAALLTKRYTRMGVQVLDLSDLLPHKVYIDQDWTTEHYTEEGRRLIASRIADALRPHFPAAYKAVNWTTTRGRSFFFNDFEGAEVWSQMHTCQADLAKSGKKSSRVGGKEKFSATWTRPVEGLDSTRLDSVAIDLWLYQKSNDHLAGLAFEASGDSVGYLWDSLGLRRFTRSVGTWSHVRFTWPLWPNLRRAELMKVYVYNPSEQFIWVDDFQIRFLGAK